MSSQSEFGLTRFERFAAAAKNGDAVTTGNFNLNSSDFLFVYVGTLDGGTTSATWNGNSLGTPIANVSGSLRGFIYSATGLSGSGPVSITFAGGVTANTVAAIRFTGLAFGIGNSPGGSATGSDNVGVTGVTRSVGTPAYGQTVTWAKGPIADTHGIVDTVSRNITSHTGNLDVGTSGGADDSNIRFCEFHRFENGNSISSWAGTKSNMTSRAWTAHTFESDR